MGRNKKYHTEEEQRQAKRDRWNKWYAKSKEELNTHRMIEYYEKRIENFQEKLSELRKRTNL